MIKEGLNEVNKADYDSESLVNDKDFILLKEAYTRFKLRYKDIQLLSIIEEGETFIPCSIFQKGLSSLEVISKYLIEEKKLDVKKISRLLNRSYANIWNSYKRAQKKSSPVLETNDSSILIPASILKNTRLSVLESIVAYLKENVHLAYHEIAKTLKRDDRTVWTVYKKAKAKTK